MILLDVPDKYDGWLMISWGMKHYPLYPGDSNNQKREFPINQAGFNGIIEGCCGHCSVIQLLTLAHLDSHRLSIPVFLPLPRKQMLKKTAVSVNRQLPPQAMHLELTELLPQELTKSSPCSIIRSLGSLGPKVCDEVHWRIFRIGVCFPHVQVEYTLVLFTIDDECQPCLFSSRLEAHCKSLYPEGCGEKFRETRCPSGQRCDLFQVFLSSFSAYLVSVSKFVEFQFLSSFI